jgi:hypothetical protein
LGHSRRFIEDLQKLQKFLLSVTAKDVSVLLTFRAIKGQLISKCPFGVQIDQKTNKKFIKRGPIKRIRALYTTDWILF